MSHTENEEWLEAAIENCRSAVEDENWSLAEAVVADIRDAGFEEAVGLEAEVKHAKEIWTISQ